MPVVGTGGRKGLESIESELPPLIGEMIRNIDELIMSGYKNTADIPRDKNMYYRCVACGVEIPSIPTGNAGCNCGNVFIDKDFWRLVVADFSKFEVIKKK